MADAPSAPSAHPVVRLCEPALERPSFYTTSPPPHHISSDPSKPLYRSPWPSRGGPPLSLLAFFRVRLFDWENHPLPPPNERLQVHQANWRADAPGGDADSAHQRIAYTWLAHASCHFQIPMPDSTPERPTSVTVVTDPIFSQRCSPVQFMGPARYDPTPTTVEDMAASDVKGAWPDVIVISHNHFDHLDANTIKAFAQHAQQKRLPHVFCPLGVKQFFLESGFDAANVTELDWWQQRQLEWDDGRSLKVTCVPAQHWSGRSTTDRGKTLWSGWTMEAVGAQAPSSVPGKKVYFAGDTSFRAVTRQDLDSGRPEEEIPYCPAFEEIGSLLGPFDLAALPIGAYRPRASMSAVHMNPREAVQVHQQVGSKKSFGIHWATFALTCESYFEPRDMLKEEAEKRKLGADEFVTVEIGKTYEC